MLKDKLVTQGNTVGKYTIQARIAEGGMGVFWRALDTKLDRVVGLKTLHAEFSVEPSLRERFVNEARALAKLNHPNICVLHDFFESSEQLYIVMEYIQGETLADLVKHRGALPRSEVVPIFRQILLALDYAHNHGVIHRDIKPSNIMVTEQGMAKVMDFGIAKMVEAPIQLTRTGRKVGSCLFMSPEQIREQPADQRSDIYSLGVTLYQVCTGKVPFDATSEYDAMKLHLEAMPVSPRTLIPDLSADLEYVIMRALAKRPEDRFQNATEMRNALGTVDLGGTGDRVVIPSGEKTRVNAELPTPPPSSKKRLPWIVGACVVVAGIAGALFMQRSTTPAPAPGAHSTPATTSQPAASNTATPQDAVGLPATDSATLAAPAAATGQPPAAQDSLALASKPAQPVVQIPVTTTDAQSQKPPASSSAGTETLAAKPAESKPAEQKPARDPQKANKPKPRENTTLSAQASPPPPSKPIVLNKYNLTVEVKPAGTYQIDRTGFGKAATRLDEGKHALEAMGAGFPIHQQTLVLKRDTSIVIDLEAAAARATFGDLRVSAKTVTGDFPACQIKINGAEAGALPGLRLPLRAGLYDVELVPPPGLKVDSLQFEGKTFAGAKARIKVPPTSRSFARYYLNANK